MNQGKPPVMKAAEHFDVLILGAGVSGVGAACHLRRECPGKSVVLLERRGDIGGTWDLFRYPGIRSDSDMYTFGYNFRPWTEPKVLADGPSIKSYVHETAREYGITEHIRYRRRAVRADFDSDRDLWTVTAEREDARRTETYTCRFLLGCTGYYNYDTGYRPDFPGESRFRGPVIHPQHWPEDLDYTGKRVVVIGSGATTITLVPAMAGDAAHVTMLQRSPSYIASLPAFDRLGMALRRFLPEMAVYRIARTRNILLQRTFYKVSQHWPHFVRRLLQKGPRRWLGEDFDLRHFDPHYNPWDQRVCVVPDGDLFRVLREGKASIVTDHIETFTENGIRLRSGRELEADIIVSATGLDLQVLGGMELAVDGGSVPVHDRLTYKGVMLEGVPNAAIVIGYINASWTLKADIASEYVCRLLGYMQRHGYTRVVPEDHEGCKTDGTIMDALNAGYVRRAADRLPRQGSRIPWRVTHDYFRDAPMLRHGRIDDGWLRFSTVSASVEQPRVEQPEPQAKAEAS